MNKVSPIQQIIDFIKEEHQKPGEPIDLNMSLLRKWCEVKLLDDEIKWHQEGSYSKEDMLVAARYGYNYHKSTQFPEQEFEDSCIRNTQQWLTKVKK